MRYDGYTLTSFAAFVVNRLETSPAATAAKVLMHPKPYTPRSFGRRQYSIVTASLAPTFAANEMSLRWNTNGISSITSILTLYGKAFSTCTLTTLSSPFEKRSLHARRAVIPRRQ